MYGSDFRKDSGFLSVFLLLHSPIKLSPLYSRNIVDGGVKHHNPSPWILEIDLVYILTLVFFLALFLTDVKFIDCTYVFFTMNNSTAYQQILIIVCYIFCQVQSQILWKTFGRWYGRNGLIRLSWSHNL